MGAALLAHGLVSPAVAGPVSVTWGAQSEGSALATASGRELPPGCLVRLGYFNLPLDHVRETAWDPVYLDACFTEIARASIGEFAGSLLDLPGSFAHTFAADSIDLPKQLANRTVCAWAIDATAPAQATEVGIFTSPAWTVEPGHFGATIWDLGQIEPAGLIVGSHSPTRSPTLGGQMNQLASIHNLWDASDLDRDGAPGLLEDAFGMNPEHPDAPLMPALVWLDSAGIVGYRFRCLAGGAQVSSAVYETAEFRYTVEVSTDLRHWRIDPAACQLHDRQSAGQGFELLTLRPTPRLSGTPDFYRLKVERLNPDPGS